MLNEGKTIRQLTDQFVKDLLEALPTEDESIGDILTEIAFQTEWCMKHNQDRIICDDDGYDCSKGA